jgi:hypothetical protein
MIMLPLRRTGTRAATDSTVQVACHALFPDAPSAGNRLIWRAESSPWFVGFFSR